MGYNSGGSGAAPTFDVKGLRNGYPSIGNILTKEGMNGKVEQMKLAASRIAARRPLISITYDDESDTIYNHAFPVHQAENVPGTFYVTASTVGTGVAQAYGNPMTWAQALEMDKAATGRIAIENHSYAHGDATALTTAQLVADLQAAHQVFADRGINTRHYAMPGGATNAAVRNVAQSFFESARTLDSIGRNTFSTNPYDLRCITIEAKTPAELEAIVNTAVSQNHWYVVYMHGVHPDKVVNGHTVLSPTELQNFIQYGKAQGVEFCSIDEGLRTFGPWLQILDNAGNRIAWITRDNADISLGVAALTARNYQYGSDIQWPDVKLALAYTSNSTKVLPGGNRYDIYLPNLGSDPMTIYGKDAGGTNRPRVRIWRYDQTAAFTLYDGAGNELAQMTMAGDIALATAGKGVIVKTPDGAHTYRLAVDNAGAVTSTLVS